MLTEFRKRRGYDPLPYLPTLTGRIVESAEASDAFLWDYRLTIGELPLPSNHYKLATDMLDKQGLGLYAEAMGIYMPRTTGDGLLNKGQVTIPMGEVLDLADAQTRGWTSSTRAALDVREATSAAHIYGKPIVATESFTSNPTTLVAWAQTPFYLEATCRSKTSRAASTASSSIRRTINRLSMTNTSLELPLSATMGSTIPATSPGPSRRLHGIVISRGVLIYCSRANQSPM